MVLRGIRIAEAGVRFPPGPPIDMDTLNKKDLVQLKELEESLWKATTRFDNGYMNKILSKDFFEFGRSGKTYTRKQTLSASPEAIKIKFPLKNFKIRKLTNKIFLVTYISNVTYKDLEVANRSSIWIKSEFGWKLMFHQGTPVILK